MDFQTAIAFLISYLPTILKVAPLIKQAVAAGKPILDAIKEVAPELVPILKKIGTTLFPAAQSDEEAAANIATAWFLPHKMTREEEEAWFQRAQGVGWGD